MIGFCSKDYLMLDLDEQAEFIAKTFAKKYAQYRDLGSSALFETSDEYKIDFFGIPRKNYAVIFGARLNKRQIRCFLNEALELGVINQRFYKMRERCGWINIRTSGKGEKKPPKLIQFFPNGDMLGILAYYRFLNMTKQYKG